jgi:hypothetical protein
MKKVLSRLEELRDYIFVTQQVVDEVYRKKVQLAADYFAQQLKDEKVKLEQTQDSLERLIGIEEYHALRFFHRHNFGF